MGFFYHHRQHLLEKIFKSLPNASSQMVMGEKQFKRLVLRTLAESTHCTISAIVCSDLLRDPGFSMSCCPIQSEHDKQSIIYA